MKKVIGWFLFWFTLCSPLLSFAVVCFVSEASFFGIASIIRKMWIMWFFIPIGVISIVLAFFLKKDNLSYKKNLIVSFICIPILLIFGSFSIIFSNYVKRTNIEIIENRIKIDFPEDIKYETIDWGSYKITYLRVNDKKDRAFFENEIKNNQYCKNQVSTDVKGVLPPTIQAEIKQYDYFVFYNITNNEYNKYPVKGECECIFIAYNCKSSKTMIVHDYSIFSET